MAWRGIHISQSARLSLRNQQLQIIQENGEVTIPIEDIAFLILDTPQCTLTGALLSALACANVAIIQSDATHHPIMMGLPFGGHHKHAQIAHMQIAITEPFKKRLWRKIIQAKITNQALHLESLGRDSGPLLPMVGLVKSGDGQNHEAQAAKIYWGKLFEKFRRANGGDIRNKMLNYGYAIVRANIARTVVAAGLVPAFGLFHNSITNGFNLVDDLIEPFRPSLDGLAYRLFRADNPNGDGILEKWPDDGFPEYGPYDGPLTLEHRRALVAVMTEPVRIQSSTGSEVMTLLAASEQCGQSLVAAMRSKNPNDIRLPKFEKNTAQRAAA